MSGKESELSILFAGVSGSSRLYEKLGQTEALHAVDRCLKRMERGVDGFRGRIVKTVGDELMAVFPTPDDALQAAGEMQQRVGDLPPVSGVKLAIRVGFHHGAVREEGGEVLGESVATAAHLAGLAKAGQVLTSAATQAALSPLQQLSTRGLDPLALKDRADGLRVFEVVWQDAADLGLPSAPRPAGRVDAGARLRVRYAGAAIVLDESSSALNMGRDPACEVAVRDRRASRNHARIERRGEHFVLADQSTNGTFVTFVGEPERFLRREELVLRGSGMIAFAASASSPDADCAEFELF